MILISRYSAFSSQLHSQDMRIEPGTVYLHFIGFIGDQDPQNSWFSGHDNIDKEEEEEFELGQVCSRTCAL